MNSLPEVPVDRPRGRLSPLVLCART